MKKISIIILNWNGLEDTRRCLRSILRDKYRNVNILVVDNGSSNNEAEKLRKEFSSKINVFQLKENLGFTGGVNFGIKKAIELYNPGYLLLLNNDVETSTGFLTKLVGTAESGKKIGLVSPVIYDLNNRNKIIFGGGGFNWFFAKTYHLNYVSRKKKTSDFLTGCCLLIKKEVIDKVGLLDERFFAYFEDSAFCINVRRKGYKCVCDPDSIIYHKESSSLGKKNPVYIYLFSRNRILFINNYTPFFYKFYFNIFNFFKTIIVLVYYLLKKEIKLLIAYAKGYRDGMMGSGGAPRL